MNAQQLKNSILQMAVQGKLVPQDPNDEPASVLLERIRAEKEKLIKEGKIKKEKNPSYIFRGEDNLPYEKVGKNEPVCIADEVPFEIPDTWEWARLGSIVFNHGQRKPETSFSYIDIGSIDNDNQTLNSKENIIESSNAPSRARKIVLYGDILYSTVRPYLHNMCIIDREFSQNPIASTGFAVLACHADLFNEYLFYYLMSPAFDTYANDTENSKGVAYPAINDDRLYKAIIPIPPVKEQHRIISLYLSLVPYIKRYNFAETRLSSLNSSFPDQLKKSILQQAVMGKLVPQDPNDEPASVLLERIRAEKDALIKAGKLKKDKHESIIYRRDNSHYEKIDGIEKCIDDEIPFEIPDNWGWTRLGTIVFNHGQKHPDTVFSYIDIGSIDNDNQTLNSNETIIDASNAPSRARKIVMLGDVLYSTVRPYLHNMCIVERKFTHEPIASTGFAVLACHADFFNKFLFFYLLSPSFDSYANDTENSKGVAYPAINDDRLYKALIPIPPVMEQHRIVSKAEEILSYCNSLVG